MEEEEKEKKGEQHLQKEVFHMAYFIWGWIDTQTLFISLFLYSFF